MKNLFQVFLLFETCYLLTVLLDILLDHQHALTVWSHQDFELILYEIKLFGIKLIKIVLFKDNIGNFLMLKYMLYKA